MNSKSYNNRTFEGGKGEKRVLERKKEKEKKKKKKKKKCKLIMGQRTKQKYKDNITEADITASAFPLVLTLITIGFNTHKAKYFAVFLSWFSMFCLLGVKGREKEKEKEQTREKDKKDFED